ncbi:MAG: leucine-rich repeat domain-containing protein [Oscillospiraceae bacterium]|nr:leucine-rich repeat domain-containing protein [Oscillospiraceae bacterium]
MKKIKIIALLVAALTLTAVFTGCGKTYSEGLEFELNGDGTGYVVAGIGSCEDKKISIPPTYQELPVTDVARKAFYSRNDLTSVEIPAGVKSIGSEAFYGCISLTSVTLPEGMTEILKYAFCACDSLKSVTIPEGVERIDQYAFAYCESLTSVKIPGSVIHIGVDAFCMCTSLKSIQYGGTVAEWGEVTSRSGLDTCTVTCTDGTVQYINGTVQ